MPLPRRCEPLGPVSKPRQLLSLLDVPHPRLCALDVRFPVWYTDCLGCRSPRTEVSMSRPDRPRRRTRPHARRAAALLPFLLAAVQHRGEAAVCGPPTLVRDIVTELVGPDAHDFLALGSSTLFAGGGTVAGVEPWITDGTPAGTRLLGDLVPGPAPSYPRFVGTV